LGSKFERDYYLAGTKFTRLDALKDAMPFWSISGGNTTVSLFFFCFIYYSEEMKREREKRVCINTKEMREKQFQSVWPFFFSVVFQADEFAFIFFSKELDCFHNNNNRTTPILEQSLFVVITYILREKAVVIINHV